MDQNGRLLLQAFIIKNWHIVLLTSLRGGVKKKNWYFWVVGAVFFLVPFDAETFKTCKYTQKKIYLGVPPHPPVNRGCQPVKGYCQRGVKISLSSLINFFSVSGDSKPKKIFRQKKLVPSPQLGEGGGRHFVVATTQKYQFFFFLTPPLTTHDYSWTSRYLIKLVKVQ